MLLIVDWLALGEDGPVVSVRTGGMNISSMSESAVNEVANEAAAELAKEGVSGFGNVHFYAAGLIASGQEAVPPQAEGLDGVLRSLFPGALIEYASDTLAAARAVCGHKPGIAAILGTGSNSCLYDGYRIVRNVRSGGFILGDEGGGARLGKLFVSDFLKGLVPEPVAGEFAADFKVDYMTVVQNVYKGGSPAGYLGAFAPWIMARYTSCEYVRELVDSNFRDFVTRVLLQYDAKTYPVGVVGGFGYANREALERVAGPYGIRFGKFLASPMEGLVEYHLGRY